MKKMNRIALYSLLIVSVFGCQSEELEKTDTLFAKLSPKQSGIQFSNDIKEDVYFHHLNWESVYNGAGVATADFDNDGLEDLYFTGNQVADAIYKNLGELKFKDLSKKAGIIQDDVWSSGVTIADVNNDGFLDIYVCRMWHTPDEQDQEKRRNMLFINQKDFTFKEEAQKYGLADTGHGTQASFFDYDRDGDLDMYLLNAPSNNYNQKLKYINANKIPYEFSDKLFRNDGSTFVDVTKQAGVEDYGFGLGLTTVDMNQDGWTDIYVANDFEIADRMFINQKDGTFKDEVQKNLKHISFSSMGTDAADLNNDGLVDIAVLDMQSADHYRSKTNMPSMDIKRFWTNVARGQHFQYMSNMLQINNGYGFFSEVAQLAGIASTDWSWSILLADFDNDSNRDIFITNGLNRDIRNNDFAEEMKKFRAQGPKSLFEFSQRVGSQKIKNLAYTRKKNRLAFEEASTKWGLDLAGFSYGAAYADLDKDGDLDLVVNNNSDRATIYRNQSDLNTENSFIRLSIIDNNHPAENVKVFLYQDEIIQSSEQSRTRGFQSSVSPIVHFGLAHTKIDSIVVVNPAGKRAKLDQLTINKEHIIEAKTIDWAEDYKYEYPPSTFFKEITGEIKGIPRHRENSYNDYDKETLLPHMQSKNGPYLSFSSGSNAGLVYMGNSHGHAGQMLEFKGDVLNEIKGPWTSDSASEDAGSCFFDFDSDGDLDLYVASGGSEKNDQDILYQDRLYINNGSSWSKSTALPANKYNGSVVRSSDFDGDGDEDLFVGSLAIAAKYPYPSASQLLVNENGNLVDRTIEFASELRNVGIVHDALWIDLNDDDLKDLIVVGEFMRPRFFENNGRQLLDKTAEYIAEELSGWWFSIQQADLDNDGIAELLLGNIGQNNKFHPNEDHPLKIYGNDFDKNSTNDIVLTKTTDQYGEVPVRGRQCSSEQMPFIKKKYEDFDGFAKADIIDIFGKKNLDSSIGLQATQFSSGYLKLDGGKYKFIALPDQAQISAIRAMHAVDLNGDKLLDIVAIGNVYDAEVETTRHDASNGMVFTQNKNGTFSFQSVLNSGLYTPGNARDLQYVSQEGKNYLFVANNNNVMQVLEQN